MKLIIDIPEEVKNRLCFGVTYTKDIQTVCEALHNGIPLEDIKAEIETNRDEWIKGQDAEWHTYDRCLSIINKHIGGKE